MGIAGTIAKAVAKKMVSKAMDSAKRKGGTKIKCPDGTRHTWVKWFNEEHPNTGVVHGPGVHTVFHCSKCGWVR